MIRKAALVALLLPGACSAYPQPPTQPTPAVIQDAYVQLSALTSDPVTTWQVGDYAVRTACYAYLNGMAQRSSDLSLAGGALGMGTGAAAIAGGHPYVAAAGALGSAFLNLLQSSGSIPYTTETSMLIEGGLDGIEAVVALQPPTSTAQALLDVQKLWWYCSAGGYRQLVSQSIIAGARSVRSMTSVTGVPRLSIESSTPAQMDVVTTSSDTSQTIQEPKRHRRRAGSATSATVSQVSQETSSDPDKPARIRWLAEHWTCIRALDGAC